MASAAAAALLDELMGRTRNFDPNDRPPELRWDSDEVSIVQCFERKDINAPFQRV